MGLSTQYAKYAYSARFCRVYLSKFRFLFHMSCWMNNENWFHWYSFIRLLLLLYLDVILTTVLVIIRIFLDYHIFFIWENCFFESVIGGNRIHDQNDHWNSQKSIVNTLALTISIQINISCTKYALVLLVLFPLKRRKLNLNFEKWNWTQWAGIQLHMCRFVFFIPGNRWTDESNRKDHTFHFKCFPEMIS